MATNIKVSGFSSGSLAYKIVYYNNDTPVATIQENVTGSSGRIYSIHVDNVGGSPVYLKMYDGSAPVLGTTSPMFNFKVGSQTAELFEMPGGVPFSTFLNIWTTRNATSLDATVPVGTVNVTLVCS